MVSVVCILGTYAVLVVLCTGGWESQLTVMRVSVETGDWGLEIVRQVVEGDRWVVTADWPGDDSDTALHHHTARGLAPAHVLTIQSRSYKLCQTLRLTLRSARDVMASCG